MNFMNNIENNNIVIEGNKIDLESKSESKNIARKIIMIFLKFRPKMILI